MLRILEFAPALAHRNYRLYAAGQCVSLIGTWMQQVGLAWLVYDLTKSSFLLGLVGFTAQAPILFIAPLAGVLSDRWNRHRTLLVTQIAAMLQAFALVLLLWSGDVQIWQILVLSGLLGVINAFDMPTRQAFLIDMVPNRSDLPNAIALNSSVVNSARLLGPFLAGLLIAVGGPISCFLFNAVSYTAVVVALLTMRDLPRRERAESPSMLRSLIEGCQYAFRFPPVRNLLLMPALISLIGIPLSTLLPVYSNDILHGGPTLFGFLTGASGAGALVSALYLIARRSVLGLGRVIVWTSAMFGATLIAFALSRSIPLSFVLMVAAGFSLMWQLGASNTLLQTIVEEDKRGRVLSLYATAFMGTAPVGSLLAGWGAERYGPTATLLVGGAVCLIAAALFARALPKMRELVHPIYREVGVLPKHDDEEGLKEHAAIAAETTAELATSRERPL